YLSSLYLLTNLCTRGQVVLYTNLAETFLEVYKYMCTKIDQ
ncbi:2241_t:CDS:1, partial [Entrophospora sp. SA101]